jgi:hypothetical protein
MRRSYGALGGWEIMSSMDPGIADRLAATLSALPVEICADCDDY